MPRGGFGFGAKMGRQTRRFDFGPGYGRGAGSFLGLTCRMFPWLPRRWWANNTLAGSITPPDLTGDAAESEYLQTQSQYLKTQLEQIEKRLAQLVTKETDIQTKKE